MSRNPYDFYITDEEYALALSNGISRKTLEYRIRNSGWPKLKAITEPVLKQRKYPEWALELANMNGISYGTFKDRIHRGWDFKKAATVSVKKGPKRKRKYPIEVIQMAQKNGIPYKTFQARVTRSKWCLIQAATTPLIPNDEVLTRAREKSSFKLGIETFWKIKKATLQSDLNVNRNLI
ncbi:MULTISPECIES: hypothetical protein [unclassified Lysinibacillus]|uniref:hypothetical protein n=1 Tax=unclassified Lysinibacillus TaxID=2636778 RepID=UPI0038109C0C